MRSDFRYKFLIRIKIHLEGGKIWMASIECLVNSTGVGGLERRQLKQFGSCPNTHRRRRRDSTGVVGRGQQLAKLTTTELPLLSALVKPSSAVIDLGVNIHGQLTMADHVAALRRLWVFQLTPATDGQIFTEFGGREDAGTRVRQQPS